jgi:HSP20 family protein
MSVKPDILPAVCVDHDRKKYHIEIELPGVKKSSIELEMGERSFCIRAEKRDGVYNACYTLAHSIDRDAVEAKFESGLLMVTAPLRDSLGGIRMPIK